MRKKVIDAEKKIKEVFRDLQKTLRLHASNDITHHPTPLEKTDNQSLGGQELFSKFTADIIKEEVLFTR